MSFSFSQNLLSDIPSSQGSHSDSSQPPTQPMMGYNMPTSSRQNFTLPRPPSCPNLTRNSTSSFYSHDQQRAKYSRVEKTITDKAALGDTLREVQVRLSSVPSSCSRMLEEGLVFLEEEITKEKEMTMASVRSMTDVIETVSHLSQGNNCGETVKIMKSAVKTSIEMVESVKKVLDTVQEDQKNTARVIDIIEDRLQNLKNDNIELLDILREANRGSNNLTEKVKKIVDEELKMNDRKAGQPNYKRNGPPARAAAPPPAASCSVLRTGVRGFSLARNLSSKVETLVDFSSVMEVDEDGDDDDDDSDMWEE